MPFYYITGSATYQSIPLSVFIHQLRNPNTPATVIKHVPSLVLGHVRSSPFVQRAPRKFPLSVYWGLGDPGTAQFISL